MKQMIFFYFYSCLCSQAQHITAEYRQCLTAVSSQCSAVWCWGRSGAGSDSQCSRQAGNSEAGEEFVELSCSVAGLRQIEGVGVGML